MGYENLRHIFRPSSVAVVGASKKVEKIGYQCLKNLIEGGYEGKIYPVNPKESEILGLKCYPDVKSIPGSVDLALIVVPAKVVKDVVKRCVEKGVKGVAIISSGFSEIGNRELEEEIVKIAKEGGMPLIGPNIVGVCDTYANCNASFCQSLPYKGNIAFISQSGALAIALVGWTWIDSVGLSALASIGNMADVSFPELIEYFTEEDKNTNCICMYIEGIKKGREFMKACKNAYMRKPVVALKAGVSKRGSVATMSHTGSLAGSAEVIKAAFRQCGILEVENLQQLFDASLALSLQPPMMGENIVIITNGGGAGVCATDAAERYGIPLKDIDETLREELKKCMPEFGSPKNPVDLTGMANKEWYKSAIKTALMHKNVDGVAVLYCHTAITEPMDVANAIYDAIKESKVKKPVIVNFVGGKECTEALTWLKKNGIPSYPDPERAMYAMGTLRRYGRLLERDVEEFSSYEDVDKRRVKEIIENAGRQRLTEHEAKEIFKAYKIPVPDESVVKSEEDAVKTARELGYPVVMKVSSPDILHKSDAGCVRVNVKNDEEVRRFYKEILENAKEYSRNAEIEGILIQKMVPYGREVIIGMTRDPQFDATIMFGLGGIFVEILKDVTFRIAPVTLREALDMVKEIKGYEILKGARGEKRKDINAVAETISRISQLAIDFPEISEIDANPIFVYEKGIVAADALITLK